MFEDVKAIVNNDPALKGNVLKNLEVILYPCLYSITVHRFISHPLYNLKIPFFPRLISQLMRFFTGIEIHPGAKIGKGFFIDHGMGVVIGETVEIGKNCTLFQRVTLGGTGNHKGKRHPTIGNNVTIGAHSTILGPLKVGDNVKIGAETVIIMHDIPSNCTVVGAPGRIVKQNGKKTRVILKKTKL